jgi:putative ATP-binding cassette transporter
VIASGAANAAVLAVINSAARTAAVETLNARLLAVFVVALAIYVIGFKYTLDAATQIFEQMLARIRLRLAERITGSELLLLHEIGRARILRSVAQDTSLISESQGLLVAAGQSAIMVAFTSLVITLSLPAFLIILGVIAAGVLIYFACEQEMFQLMQQSAAQDVTFIGMTDDLIDGLKEIRLSTARGAGIIEDVSRVVIKLRDIPSARPTYITATRSSRWASSTSCWPLSPMSYRGCSPGSAERCRNWSPPCCLSSGLCLPSSPPPRL